MIAPRAASRYGGRVRSLLGCASLLVILFATGCPRQPDAPEPGMGTACEQLSDCNPTETCGALKLCVDGFCEAGRSLIRPCPGSGVPVRPP